MLESPDDEWNEDENIKYQDIKIRKCSFLSVLESPVNEMKIKS